jgi:predicted GNAT family acetyltransferase
MTENVQVRDNSGESRYEIRVDGELAGFTEYVLHGSQADFVHTQIDDKFGGRGLASELIREALDDARERGWQVMPYCPFVRSFITKHTEYRDLVPQEHQAKFGLA